MKIEAGFIFGVVDKHGLTGSFGTESSGLLGGDNGLIGGELGLMGLPALDKGLTGPDPRFPNGELGSLDKPPGGLPLNSPFVGYFPILSNG